LFVHEFLVNLALDLFLASIFYFDFTTVGVLKTLAIGGSTDPSFKSISNPCFSLYPIKWEDDRSCHFPWKCSIWELKKEKFPSKYVHALSV
jgi:hypothetical protein